MNTLSNNHQDELRMLLGLRRTGKITAEEFLKGIWFACNSSSRSGAEKTAWRWFDINGRYIAYTREFYLAVGYLTKHRLQMEKRCPADFSSVFVRMLSEANVTIAEAERSSLTFSVADYRAGALELVSLYKRGKISRNEVELAFTAATTAKSAGEAERLAQSLLYQSRTQGFTDATPLRYAFCVVCLWYVGVRSGENEMNREIAEIKRLVYASERIAKASAVATFDPAISRPMVVQTKTELLYFGRPARDGYREIAVTPPSPDEKVLPPRRAKILGMGFYAQRGPLEGLVGAQEIQIGYPMILKPPQPLKGRLLWATSSVVEVEIL